MIVGFGTKDQEATLKTAGAERVFFHPEQTPDLFKYAGSAVRAGDTFLVVQPTLLRVVDYRDLHEACAKGLTFQVVGNDPLPISQNMNFTEFRRTRAKGVQNTYAAAPTGRPAAIVYSLEQADAILREKPEITATMAWGFMLRSMATISRPLTPGIFISRVIRS